MTRATHRYLTLGMLLLVGLLPVGATRVGAAQLATAPASPPAVGEAARDFTLARMDGEPITLSALTKQGPVVIIMLRGWVGYQ